jgi:hypothetical protein
MICTCRAGLAVPRKKQYSPRLEKLDSAFCLQRLSPQSTIWETANLFFPSLSTLHPSLVQIRRRSSACSAEHLAKSLQSLAPVKYNCLSHLLHFTLMCSGTFLAALSRNVQFESMPTGTNETERCGRKDLSRTRRRETSNSASVRGLNNLNQSTSVGRTVSQ